MDKHKIIEEMREDCECEKCNYCPPEKMISVNPRIFKQHKLVEKLKIESSALLKKEIGWNEAYILWKDEGHAERFAEVYNENLTYKELKIRMS